MITRGQYETDGFALHTAPLLTPVEVSAAVEGQKAICRGEYETGRAPQPSPWNPGDDPQKLVKIEMPQMANRAVLETVGHPEVGRAAAQITGAKAVQVWWVQMLIKPSIPADEPAATNIGWHQDRHYWRVWEEGSELLTAWIALTDVTERSGPMRFVRGSHRWGLMEGAGNFHDQDHDAQRGQIGLPEGAVWEEAPALLPAGGVSFHHHLTLHASGRNVSGEPRRSFAVHMRTEKSRPVGGKRAGLSQFIDDESVCPAIYGDARHFSDG